MLRVLLVRHGQSEWNADGRWQGQADPPLSDLGRAQAEAAAERLGMFDAIVASPLDRALTTAQIISSSLGIGPLLVDEDLVERDAGEWSGLTRSGIEKAWPDYLTDGRRPPGYEDDESLHQRVNRALDRLTENVPHGEVLVIAHGGVIYVLEGELGADFERIPNLGARWFEWDGRSWSLGERVQLIDDRDLTVQAPDIL